MNATASAAWESWGFRSPAALALLATAVLYLVGWIRGRRRFRHPQDGARLGFFLAGLGAMFLALASPLDALDEFWLSAHMTQHMLLMMVAPPLLLLGHPTVPFLRALPRAFVKEGLAPFLTFAPLKRVLGALVYPPVAFVLFSASTLLWHLPRFYELALRDPAWHGAQHACFFWTGICFWWPVVESRRRGGWPRWALIPYLLLGDVLNTALSSFLIFSGQVLYPSYGGADATAALRDQAVAGAIMWVPGSIVYLIPAIRIVVDLLSPAPPRRPGAIATRVERKRSRGWAGGKLSARRVRGVARPAMLALAVLVVADGLWGTRAAPYNLAGVLPWIHWRMLAVAALLTAGNLFCMACPFTLVRDAVRRVIQPRWRWPRALRNKWISIGLLVLFLWSYEAFGLWNSPRATAFLILGYFVGIVAVDALFRDAAFCKYVCPIGQFHFIGSLVSWGEVRVRSQATCQACSTYDCIRGNERARGCELQLFQPKKVGNLDCTFCLDCVQACPHDNVALLPILPAQTLLKDPYLSSIGRLSGRTDLAAMALLIVFGAFVNAAGMTQAVMMREHRWHALAAGWIGLAGTWMMPVVVAAFVAAGVLLTPALAVACCGGWNRLALPRGVVGKGARRFAFALVPLGMAMWAAHLLFHFSSGWAQAWPAWQTFLHRAPAVLPASNLRWVLPAQFLLLDAGLLLTLFVLWRVALELTDRARSALAVASPWLILAASLYVSGIWIVFQPMQMRGMPH